MSKKEAVTVTIAVVSGTLALVLAVAAFTELVRYSPYEDPGAGAAGLWLSAACLACATVSFAALIARARVIGAVRGYFAWRRALPPQQRAALAAAEALAMEGAHLAWKHHNAAESARLAESVMGHGEDTGK